MPHGAKRRCGQCLTGFYTICDIYERREAFEKEQKSFPHKKI